MSELLGKLLDRIKALAGFFYQPDTTPPSTFDGDAFVDVWNRANPLPVGSYDPFDDGTMPIYGGIRPKDVIAFPCSLDDD